MGCLLSVKGIAILSVVPLGLALSFTAAQQLEKLGRGAIAVPASTGMLVRWRLLNTDPSSVSFNVYKGGVKLNTDAIKTTTNYLDKAGTATSTYTVKTVVNGVETQTATATVFAKPYISIPVSKPAGSTTPDGQAYTYEINDGSVADLDGDGEYEYVETAGVVGLLVACCVVCLSFGISCARCSFL